MAFNPSLEFRAPLSYPGALKTKSPSLNQGHVAFYKLISGEY